MFSNWYIGEWYMKRVEVRNIEGTENIETKGRYMRVSEGKGNVIG